MFNRILLALLVSYVICITASRKNEHDQSKLDDNIEVKHKYRSYGICNVRLPKICLGNEPCIDSIPPREHHPFRFSQYNVVSFNNVVATQGQIGGRVAARNNITMAISGGYVVGSQAHESHHHKKRQRYSFVAGGYATWNQGTLLPNSETAFVGEKFNAPDYLLDRLGASCTETGCLEDAFDYAQKYYSALSDVFSSLPNNVEVSYQNGGIYLKCGSSNSNGASYVAQLDAQQISGSNWYNIDASCEVNSSWVFNIDLSNSNSILFQGGAVQLTAERVLYNINGTASIKVTTGVNGNILAPRSSYYQDNGNTQGLVVVGDITSISTANNPSCGHHSDHARGKHHRDHARGKHHLDDHEREHHDHDDRRKSEKGRHHSHKH